MLMLILPLRRNHGRQLCARQTSPSRRTHAHTVRTRIHTRGTTVTTLSTSWLASKLAPALSRGGSGGDIVDSWWCGKRVAGGAARASLKACAPRDIEGRPLASSAAPTPRGRCGGGHPVELDMWWPGLDRSEVLTSLRDARDAGRSAGRARLHVLPIRAGPVSSNCGRGAAIGGYGHQT